MIPKHSGLSKKKIKCYTPKEVFWNCIAIKYSFIDIYSLMTPQVGPNMLGDSGYIRKFQKEILGQMILWGVKLIFFFL